MIVITLEDIFGVIVIVIMLVVLLSRMKKK